MFPGWSTCLAGLYLLGFNNLLGCRTARRLLTSGEWLISKVRPQGQAIVLTIPAVLQRAMLLKSGDLVAVKVEDSEMRVRRVDFGHALLKSMNHPPDREE
jgi:antitoxin component of MazEF toxin-antitoxin module